VIGRISESVDATTGPTLSWAASGTSFTSGPTPIAAANVPVTVELTVSDHLPHSVALEKVRDGQPVVAVDGPGTNQRGIELPAGTCSTTARSLVTGKPAWRACSPWIDRHLRQLKPGRSKTVFGDLKTGVIPGPGAAMPDAQLVDINVHPATSAGTRDG
jgi:hypothetical protein